MFVGGGGVKGRQRFSLPISSVFVGGGGGVKGRQRFLLPISSLAISCIIIYQISE